MGVLFGAVRVSSVLGVCCCCLLVWVGVCACVCGLGFKCGALGLYDFWALAHSGGLQLVYQSLPMSFATLRSESGAVEFGGLGWCRGSGSESCECQDLQMRLGFESDFRCC